MPALDGRADAQRLTEQLARYVRLRSVIEAFWLDPDHRGTSGWLEHENINEVMLASSLVPSGYLALTGLADE